MAVTGKSGFGRSLNTDIRMSLSFLVQIILDGEVNAKFPVPTAERVEPGGKQAVHLAGG